MHSSDSSEKNVRKQKPGAQPEKQDNEVKELVEAMDGLCDADKEDVIEKMKLEDKKPKINDDRSDS